MQSANEISANDKIPRFFEEKSIPNSAKEIYSLRNNAVQKNGTAGIHMSFICIYICICICICSCVKSE